MLITILNGYSIHAQSLEFTPNQYHIQTDEGNSRFFKYQTWGGQYRKETRLDDGSVVGSYGWIDANGILRMYHYIADDDGYRITKDNSYNVEEKELNNLVGVEQPVEEKPLVETSKQKEGRKLKFVKKTKAEFTLPKATFSTPSSRFQRRISPDFVPIFAEEEEDNLLTPKTTAKTIVKSLPRKVKSKVSQLPRNPRIPIIQPRGEGYRTRYVRQQSNQIPLTRQANRFKSRRPTPSSGKFYVVKRRRRLPTNKFSNRRINIEEDFDYEQAKETVNFQTDKTFHHEGILDSGERIGEFGYIDPIGVRRVVQYATNSPDDQTEGGIFKTKENDFYGPNTYFEAN